MNEQVREAADRLDTEPAFLCESADVDCTARLQVPPAEYERVRGDGRRFIVAPGHEQPPFERVVEHAAGWLVVEKVSKAGEEAAERDPRSS